MHVNITLTLLLLVTPIMSIQIPFIRDVIFTPLSKSNSTTIINRTCAQCLCMSSSSYLILNCFPNNTCQFFYNFSRTYKIQQIIDARLYFLQRIFPNTSQCCMPDIDYLLNKLKTATPTYGSVLSPRCLVLDDHGYLVTLSEVNNSIIRFNATNMSLINRTSSLITNPLAITYYNKTYYVGLLYNIFVIDSVNLTIVNNISSSYLSGTRDMMFLNNGDTMVVASTTNRYLLFFNRTMNASTNYQFAYKKLVNYTYPHGLFPVTDTYFYSTSWSSNTIYSYTAIQNSTGWKENLVLDARSMAPSSNGNHVKIDECGRFWFSLGDYGLKIYDNQGLFLANLTFTNTSIFDTIITDNYIIYLSDINSNRVIRIDPDIQC